MNIFESSKNIKLVTKLFKNCPLQNKYQNAHPIRSNQLFIKEFRGLGNHRLDYSHSGYHPYGDFIQEEKSTENCWGLFQWRKILLVESSGFLSFNESPYGKQKVFKLCININVDKKLFFGIEKSASILQTTLCIFSVNFFSGMTREKLQNKRSKITRNWKHTMLAMEPNRNRVLEKWTKCNHSQITIRPSTLSILMELIQKGLALSQELLEDLVVLLTGLWS